MEQLLKREHVLRNAGVKCALRMSVRNNFFKVFEVQCVMVRQKRE